MNTLNRCINSLALLTLVAFIKHLIVKDLGRKEKKATNQKQKIQE